MDGVLAQVLEQQKHSINRLVGAHNKLRLRLHLALNRIEELERKLAAIESAVEEAEEEPQQDPYKCHGD